MFHPNESGAGGSCRLGKLQKFGKTVTNGFRCFGTPGVNQAFSQDPGNNHEQGRHFGLLHQQAEQGVGNRQHYVTTTSATCGNRSQ